MKKIIFYLLISFVLINKTVYSFDSSIPLIKRESNEKHFIFKVVSFTEKEYDMFLYYEGEKYLMELDFYPLYVYKMPQNKLLSETIDEIKYHFGACEIGNDKNVIDEEAFERVHSLEMNDSFTYNHIFQNEIDLYKHSYLPRVYEKFNTTELSELFDDRFVATIIFKLNKHNNEMLEKYHNNPAKGMEDIKGTMIYISPFAVKVFNEVSINLSGDRSINNKKLSYKVTDIEGEDGNGLYNRKAIKLRANQSDYSYIREKLVYSLLDSMGVPVQGCTFARVIINERSIGLFTLVDHISNYHFLRQVFNNGEKISKKDNTLLFKTDNVMTSVSNMDYHGDDPNNPMYDSYQLKKSTYCKNNNVDVEEYDVTAKKESLIPFLKKIHDLQKSDIELFEEKSFHLESYLRSLVLDYLCQGVDNYLFWADNYYLYRTANKQTKDYRWYFISTDFHFTFGSDGFTQQIKDTFYNQSAYNIEIDTVRQPLTKLLELDREVFTARIDGIIKETLKKAFNPAVLYPFIDSLVVMIKNDVQWDLLLGRVNPDGRIGKINNYEFFYFSVTDEDNILSSPIPLKTFIRHRTRHSSQHYNLDLPDSVDAIDIKYGFTQPKFVSTFIYNKNVIEITNHSLPLKTKAYLSYLLPLILFFYLFC